MVKKAEAERRYREFPLTTYPGADTRPSRERQRTHEPADSVPSLATARACTLTRDLAPEDDARHGENETLVERDKCDFVIL
jgi:hypothetical protein